MPSPIPFPSAASFLSSFYWFSSMRFISSKIYFSESNSSAKFKILLSMSPICMDEIPQNAKIRLSKNVESSTSLQWSSSSPPASWLLKNFRTWNYHPLFYFLHPLLLQCSLKLSMQCWTHFFYLHTNDLCHTFLFHQALFPLCQLKLKIKRLLMICLPISAVIS